MTEFTKNEGLALFEIIILVAIIAATGIGGGLYLKEVQRQKAEDQK
ncbi:MAG: hypothetical protein HY220_00785 [Candidatus Sungbacteria bacterium]|uniref:Uncharacterized protein n=1 Tax=Candidatus Sungiibacteriota bacterium TaxID=2750080 RepID=A0A9D6LT84_9BACT|nr:hypothetical protein [Candidatus Sungbacteria bacterium]